MRRGSTPIVAINVDGMVFDDYTVVVTFDQDGTQVTKSTDSSLDILITKNYDEEGNVTGSTVAVFLTQEETLKFDVGVVRVQLRWIDAFGNAFVSAISSISLKEVLYEKEIEYGE